MIPINIRPSLDLADFNDRYGNALTAGDVESLVSLYDEDAIMLGAGVSPVEGTAALNEYYQGVTTAGLKSAKLTSVRSRVEGGLVVDTGRYEMEIEPDITDAGKYVHVFRQNSVGEWTLWHDMFVSDRA